MFAGVLALRRGSSCVIGTIFCLIEETMPLSVLIFSLDHIAAILIALNLELVVIGRFVLKLITRLAFVKEPISLKLIGFLRYTAIESTRTHVLLLMLIKEFKSISVFPIIVFLRTEFFLDHITTSTFIRHIIEICGLIASLSLAMATIDCLNDVLVRVGVNTGSSTSTDL